MINAHFAQMTLNHLVLYCQYTKQILQHFTQSFKAKTEKTVNINIHTFYSAVQMKVFR